MVDLKTLAIWTARKQRRDRIIGNITLAINALALVFNLSILASVTMGGNFLAASLAAFACALSYFGVVLSLRTIRRYPVVYPHMLTVPERSEWASAMAFCESNLQPNAVLDTSPVPVFSFKKETDAALFKMHFG